MKLSRVFGFTLVELLIAMALSVLVGGVMYLLQSTGMAQVNKGTTRITLESELRRAMELLVSDLRCAFEVMEIAPGSIKISQYKSSGDESNSGDIELKTITYTLEKNKKKSVLTRSDSKRDSKEIFSTDHLEAEMFLPFYEIPPGGERENPEFLPFDMSVNDTDQRKQITFIRIHLKARQAKEFVTLVSSVTLRPAHQRLYQGHWKLR